MELPCTIVLWRLMDNDTLRYWFLLSYDLICLSFLAFLLYNFLVIIIMWNLNNEHNIHLRISTVSRFSLMCIFCCISVLFSILLKNKLNISKDIHSDEWHQYISKKNGGKVYRIVVLLTQVHPKIWMQQTSPFI